MHYTIHCDAGSKGNPGYAYGSYKIDTCNFSVTKPRIMLDESATCNQAEFMILITAIKDIKNRPAEPNSDKLTIYSDSKLLVMTSLGKWKLKSQTLLPLRNELLSLLRRFQSYDIQWTSRNTMVALFGH